MSNYTTNFNLELPSAGSYFGTWNVPVNANMSTIDTTLFNIKTCNKNVAQNSITDLGALWFGSDVLYLKASTGMQALMTTSQLVLTLPQQTELKSGNSTSLHYHSGSSTIPFMVQDPNVPNDANKNYYAVPYGLFNSTTTTMTTTATGIRTDLTTLQNKVNTISTNGIDLHVGSITASGDVISSKGLTATLGTTGATLKLGGGTSTTEAEIITSNINPINFKSTAGGTLNVQVQGYNIWHTGNDGAGSGLDADTVDTCGVNDSITTTTNLWTADKTNRAILANIPDTVNNANHLSGLDVSSFPYSYSGGTNTVSGKFALTSQIPVQATASTLGTVMPGIGMGIGSDGKLNVNALDGSNAANGYIKFPNGLKIMWGFQMAGGTVSFSPPFTQAPYSVTATSVGNPWYINVSAVTTSSFVCNLNYSGTSDNASGRSGPFYWIAIGI